MTELEKPAARDWSYPDMGREAGQRALAPCAELTWQLRGEADKRQVAGATVATQHNLVSAAPAWSRCTGGTTSDAPRRARRRVA